MENIDYSEWQPDEDLIEAAQEKIEELEARIRAEREKVPTETQWAEMSPYERRQWARNTTPEQREKILYRAG